MEVVQRKKNYYRYVIFVFLFCTFTLQFATYLSWNPFIPLAKNLFGFSASNSALIVATVALGRMIFQIPGGILVDIFSAKKLLIISLLALAMSCIVVGASNKYITILFGQFLIGMSGVVIWPLCIKIVINCFSSNECDFMSGLLNVGASVAVVLTNSFIPIVTNTFYWNINFYLMSTSCIILAILIFKSLKLNVQKYVVKRNFLSNFHDLIKDKFFLLAMSVHAGAIYTTWGINSWLAMYLAKGVNMTSLQISQIMFYFGIFGCLGMILAGKIVQGNFNKRCLFLLVDLGVMALLLLFIPWIKNENILYVYVSILGLVAFAHFGPLNIFVSNLVKLNVLATALAVSIFVWQIASIIQSLCIGKILDYLSGNMAYTFMFYILDIGAIIACISLGYIIRNKIQIYAH